MSERGPVRPVGDVDRERVGGRAALGEVGRDVSDGALAKIGYAERRHPAAGLAAAAAGRRLGSLQEAPHRSLRHDERESIVRTVLVAGGHHRRGNRGRLAAAGDDHRAGHDQLRRRVVDREDLQLDVDQRNGVGNVHLQVAIVRHGQGNQVAATDLTQAQAQGVYCRCS